VCLDEPVARPWHITTKFVLAPPPREEVCAIWNQIEIKIHYKD
jgi:hypothetical protein